MQIITAIADMHKGNKNRYICVRGWDLAISLNNEIFPGNYINV